VSARGGTAGPNTTKTILALGAHYDDWVFGIPGTLIKAARKGHRVVVLTLIGDYSNFAPARERSAELRDGCIEIGREYGAELRFLDLKGHHFDATVEETKRVAQVAADVRPDVAFLLWPHDRHGDHVSASRICENALRHAGPLLDQHAYRPPSRLYAYDNGPRHTINFVPETYVDVTQEWPAAMAWLARTMLLAYGQREGRHPALDLKETLAAYRGKTCGVKYAEAVKGLDAYPQEIF